MLVCAASSALAQSAKLELQQSRYEMRLGEAVPLAMSAETVTFLLNAKTQKVEIDGVPSDGLVASPNQAKDQVLLGASARMAPGKHTVKLTATSETGEERQSAFDVVVQALPTVPSGSKRPPVVMLNGWISGFTGLCNTATSSADTFGNLAQLLVADGVPIVYLFDNCLQDPNASIETLGNDLGLFLNSIKYDNGSQVEQIDLVAFSMGGLIARSYLAGLQPQTGLVLTPPADTLVRKLVLIATPNWGSFVAATYSSALSATVQGAEMIPGSGLLWNLGTWNQNTDDLRGVDAIAIVGNAGAYNSTVANASDGLVTTTSASLGFVAQQMSLTRVVPYCHIDPATFTNTSLGTFNCIGQGIANVTDTNHLTGQIVRSFLADNKDWQSIGTSASSDNLLSKNGGSYFVLVSSGGANVADVTSVTWGSVTLQMGGSLGTVFYDDLVSGTGQFKATSKSLGSVVCGSLQQAVGYVVATRCKFNATITSVSPLAKVAGRVVSSGASLTINGSGFGSKCGNCQVTATPSGSGGSQTLTTTSWTNTAITVSLPASLTGLQTLTVTATTSSDSFRVMASPAAAGIVLSPTSLQFGYAIGGQTPASQALQISNSGTGTLSWTATSSDAWLVLSSTSGTAPSTVSVSVAPSGLSVGSYQGTVQISASDSSITPVAVSVTLMVTQSATLGVTPQKLAFQYTLGGAAPPAQPVSISNGSGSDVLSWTASAGDAWVSLDATSGNTPATLSISVNPANLAAGSYTSNVQIAPAGSGGTPTTVAVTLVVQAAGAGTITAVVNTASSQPGIASAGWVSIFGTGLSTATDAWQTSNFVNGVLPTSLDGVSVTINNVPAYVAYVSPTQINVLAPDDTTVGPVQVQVTAGQQQSNAFTAQKGQFAPAFFTLGTTTYAVAQHADYSTVGSPNLLPGVVTQPATPGEVIQLYGTGFGPANPPAPTGQVVTTASVLANQVQVTIGGVAAPVAFAGIVGSGTYQLNVTVPDIPNGDAAVVATVGGVSTQTGVLITVQK
jgi:uncharacterized protein (TIGR03437 family)